MSALGLAAALEQRQWELAALYLLLALDRVLEALPPDTLPAVLDLLSQEGPGPDEADEPC